MQSLRVACSVARSMMDRKALETVLMCPLPVSALPVCALLVCTALLQGCGDDASSKEPVSSSSGARVVSVAAKRVGDAEINGFCDVHPASGDRPALRLPTGMRPGPDKTTLDSGVFHWINFWATWCEPCIEEIPRIARAQALWKKEGLDVRVHWISVDADEEAFQRAVTEKEALKHSMRLDGASQLESWLQGLGMTGTTSVPVHVFGDKQGRMQCIRSGGVDDQNLGVVRAMFQ